MIPSLRALIETALRQLESEQPAEAEKSLRAALAINPRDDQLLNLLGVALVRQQREEEAIEPLKKAISINRRDAEYHNALGCALRNTGRVDEGIESLQRALKLEPELQGARFNLAQAFQYKRDFERAGELFREVLARDPGDVETVNALAAQQWQLGDYEASLLTVRRPVRPSGPRDPASRLCGLRRSSLPGRLPAGRVRRVRTQLPRLRTVGGNPS